jgi:hypothetical protein
MGEDYSNVFRPKPDCAFGNLVLSMLSHFISAENPKFHKDVFLYGRDKFIQSIQTVDIEEVPVGNATINSEDMKILHLKYLNTTEVMNIMIRPTEYLKQHIDKYYEQVKDCVAGFHCRRGLSCEDSAQFGYFPFANMKAVDAMIHEALRLDAPVYFLSDSVSTKSKQGRPNEVLRVSWHPQLSCLRMESNQIELNLHKKVLFYNETLRHNLLLVHNICQCVVLNIQLVLSLYS